eukprot:GSMAST32.ASY1.ANO1.2338.1 assembled CDS
MHDVFPSDMQKRSFIEDSAKAVASSYGFREISTPIVEFTDVFNRTLGNDSDIVSKEMYTFVDGPTHRQRSLTLRPENTAGVMRALLSSKHIQPHDLPQKYYYCGPMFRRERPQKGRYRQFRQFGVELCGESHALADVEVITMAANFLSSLGFQLCIRLEINSLGDIESRVAYEDALRSFLEIPENFSMLSTTKSKPGQVLRILDSKIPSDQSVLSKAPQMASYLSDDAQCRFQEVQNGLNSLNVSFCVNPSLVRGLDYYGHTAFEFVADLNYYSTDGISKETKNLKTSKETKNSKETKHTSIVAVAAGGRYDTLASQMGSSIPLPSIGWAAGIERLELMLDKKCLPKDPLQIAIAPISQHIRNILIPNSNHEKNVIHSNPNPNDFSVWNCFESKRFTTHLKTAMRVNADVMVIIGSDEVRNKSVTLRNLKSREQENIPFEDITRVIRNMYK